jgi:hypothetical protein
VCVQAGLERDEHDGVHCNVDGDKNFFSGGAYTC